MELLEHAKARLKRTIQRISPTEMERYRLSSTYLRGEGIEVGALHNPLRVADGVRVRYVDRLAKSDLLRQYPELAGLNVIDPDIVDDGERLQRITDESLDFIIANHFIEHCEDPLLTLQNFSSKLKRGGIIYLAVPDKRFTFDSQRASTSFDHLEADYRDHGAASRRSHYVDFARYSHFRGRASPDDIEQLATSMAQTSYSIHFHVWEFTEFGEFLSRARLGYLPELEVVESRLNRKEGIYILRKSAADRGLGASAPRPIA